jgi:hypothetical protein
LEKLGWFAFYPRDWYSDPDLAVVSPMVRGIWIDFLCAMFIKETYFLTGDRWSLSRLARCDEDDFDTFISALKCYKFADVTECNGDVTTYTIICRRFLKESKARADVRERVRRHRSKGEPSDERNESVTGNVAISTSVSVYSSVSSSLSDLDLWFKDVFVPAYPEHRQVQTKTAIARLKGLKPDVAERMRILDVLGLWKQSAEWTRDEGKYVPGMGRFFADGWHNRQPRAAPAGPRLSPGRQSLFESIQRDREKEHGTVGSEVTAAQSVGHLDPPTDRRRGAG